MKSFCFLTQILYATKLIQKILENKLPQVALIEYFCGFYFCHLKIYIYFFLVISIGDLELTMDFFNGQINLLVFEKLVK